MKHIIILSFFLWSLELMASGKDQLEGWMTSKTENVVRGILGHDRFTVAVNIELRQQAERRPAPAYLPAVGGANPANEASGIAKFLPLIQTIQAVIAVDADVDNATIQIMKDVLKIKLGVTDQIIAAFQFVKYPVKKSDNSEFEARLDKLNNEVARLENEYDELQSETNGLKREKATGEQELKQTKSDLDQARQEILELIAKNKQQTPGSFFDRNESHFVWIIAAFVIGAISIVLLMIPSRIFLKGLTNVGDAVKDMGRNLAEASKAKTPPPESQVGLSKKVSPERSEQKFQDLPALPAEILEKRLEHQVSDLVGYLRSQDVSSVVSYIGEQINDPDSTAKVVLLFECLGQELSEMLFDNLSDRNQSLFSQFLKKYRPPRAKLQMTLDTFAEIKIRIESKKFRNILADLDDGISLKLEALNITEIVDFLDSVDHAWWPRILLHLKADTVAQVLNRAVARGNLGEELLGASVAISEHRNPAEYDRSIIEALSRRAEDLNQHESLPVKSFLLEVVDSLPQETAQKLVHIAEAQNERLGRSMSEHLITMEDFWSMPQNQLAEVIADLTTADIASLMRLDHDRADKILWEALPIRRQELIKDELDMFEADAGEQDFTEIIAKVIQLLKAKREQGSWSKASQQNDLPAAS